jgi:hypothetical protein
MNLLFQNVYVEAKDEVHALRLCEAVAKIRWPGCRIDLVSLCYDRPLFDLIVYQVPSTDYARSG